MNTKKHQNNKKIPLVDQWLRGYHEFCFKPMVWQLVQVLWFQSCFNAETYFLFTKQIFGRPLCATFCRKIEKFLGCIFKVFNQCIIHQIATYSFSLFCHSTQSFHSFTVESEIHCTVTNFWGPDSPMMLHMGLIWKV